MRNRIEKSLFDAGACDFGVVRARVFEELRETLIKRGEVSLCEKDIEKRINPFLTYPYAKSIIVCLFSYNTGIKDKISEYALGKDYHTVIKNRLSLVSKLLENEGYAADIFVDNGPLSERYLAYLAGLGFFGMNGMLINEKFGSKVFIAGIVTDCELSENSLLDVNVCIKCKKCIEACPGGAISDDFGFDEKKCVSYLTQKKGELSKSEKTIIKNSGYVWGCDICQNVCPYNYSLKCTNIHEFLKSEPSVENVTKDMSNSQFKRIYGDKAYAWRGKSVLVRNMEIFH